MFRLLSLLTVAMFLTLLLGGQDRGQVRLGLAAGPAPVKVAAAPEPELAPEVTLTAYVPVAAPAAPRTAPPVAEPEVAVAEVPTDALPQPELPTFTLSTLEPASPTAMSAPLPGDSLPVRYVRSASINVREGPSTGHPVVGRLTRNEAVSVVAEAPDGWLRVRIEGDGIDGFVAARLLTDQAP